MLLEFSLIRGYVELPVTDYELLLGFSVVYIVLGVGLFVYRREQFQYLLRRTAGTVSDAISSTETRPKSADD